jgi:glycosyltransferase involved in cell wall biosynthesis
MPPLETHGRWLQREPLSLLFVGPLPPHQGGAAMFSAQLLSELARRGHEIQAISAITSAALEHGDAFASTHSELDVQRYELPYLATGPDIPPSQEYLDHERGQIAELVQRAVDRRRPDILFAGREMIVPQLEGLDCTRGLPRMLVIHGTAMFGIARGTFPRERAEPLIASMRSYDLIVTSGRHARESMAELGVPGVQVIPNPVDLDRFGPREPDTEMLHELEIPDGATVVLHASKLTEQKRPMDILGAAERALAQDGQLVFVVAGDGRLREQVESECGARGLSEHFRFPGWIQHERMPALMSVASVILMPSAYECQALVYLEAMACARPLIASDIPASREVVQHGVNGLLHAEGDEARLTELILDCTRDSALASRLVEGGRVTAAEHALPRIADAYEEALASLLGVKPSSA